jgi:hypothetical protein
MYRCGSSDGCRECSAQIEQGNGFAKGKDDERRSITNPVDAPRDLECFGCARINIPCAIEDCPIVFGAAVFRQVVVPACSPRARGTKMVPTHRMRSGSEVDACERCAGCKNQSLRANLAKRSNAGGLRKLGQLSSGAREVACQRNSCLYGPAAQQPFARAQGRRVAIQLQFGVGQHEPVNNVQRK